MMIDRVVRVARIPRSGETVTANATQVHAGGKGANQAAAAAKCGARVRMLGRTGEDGRCIVDALRSAGVDTSAVSTADFASGHATVMVAQSGENAIVIAPEANARLSIAAIEEFLSVAHPGERLLLQNECALLTETIALASSRSLSVWLNAAPVDASLGRLPLERLAGLIVNEHEAEALTGASNPGVALDALAARVCDGLVLLTLGAHGVVAARGKKRFAHRGFVVDALDTVGCGDAFIGAFLAAIGDNASLELALARGNAAGALTATRGGAIPALPSKQEVDLAAASPEGTRLPASLLRASSGADSAGVRGCRL